MGEVNANEPTISSGYTAGSFTLVVSSGSGLASNHLAQVRQSNDPSNIYGSISGSTHWQRQMARITNVSGTTVMLNRPLFQNYSNSYTPTLTAFSRPITFSGIEEMTVKMTNSASFNGIWFYLSHNCWATNVTVTNSVYSNIRINQSARTSIVGCTTRNHQAYDSTSRYGIEMVEFTTDSLIQDNIVQGNNLAISMEQGCSGNVIAYNFSNKGFSSSFPAYGGNVYGGLSSHGDFCHHNLFEGNVAPWISTDEYWGVNTTNTIHRNWLTRYVEFSPTNGAHWSSQGTTALYIDATNYQMQVTGNIIGHPRDSLITNGNVWLVGFARRQGNDFGDTAWDTITTNTLTKTGNFDWSTNGTYWVGGSPTTLSNSYYLASKPGWFGTLAWPPIGPDVSTADSMTNSAIIPAQARWLDQNYTTAPDPYTVIGRKLKRVKR